MHKSAFLLGVSLFATAAPAWAQEAASDEVGVPEIVVSAQRRTERLQDVPVSVTALGADALKTRNVNDLTQVVQAAPSLQVGADNTFAIRGVGTQAFATTIDSSVATSLDDVNLGRPYLAQGLFNDVERVEVLNGPQGLLFGKNASAGLLNVVTTRPRLGEWESTTNLELDNRETPGSDAQSWSVIARETVNIPVSENSALRINGTYSYEQPGTTYKGLSGVRNDLDREQYGLRGKYLIELTPSLELYVIGEYSQSHGIAGIYDRTYRSVGEGSVNTDALAATGLTAGDENFTFGGDGGYWRDLTLGGAQAALSWTSPGGVVVSNIAAWKSYRYDAQLDTDFTNLDGASRNWTHSKYDQFSNELRIALPSENRLSGQAGLYYFHSKVDQQSQIAGNNYFSDYALANFFCVGSSAPSYCGTTNSYFLGRDNRYSMTTDSYAAFGQLTYEIVDGLKAFAGGRVTRDEIAIDLVQNEDAYFAPLAVSGTFEQDYGHTNFSWRAGGQYEITPDAMVYASYGRGYKGPGFNDTAATADASLLVKGETSETAEIGFKTSWFHRALVFNLSAFHTRFNNYQVQSLDSELQAFIVQNAASVISKGIEASINARPFEGLSLNASATLLDSKFDSFAGAECYPGQPNAECEATASDYSNGSFNAKGYRTPTSARFTSSVQAMYEFQTSGFVHPFLEANWYHRSPINYLINRAPGATVSTLDMIGASAGLNLDNGMRFTVFCKNCTSAYNPNFIGLDSGDSISHIATYQQQFGFDSVRTIGATVQFQF